VLERQGNGGLVITGGVGGYVFCGGGVYLFVIWCLGYIKGVGYSGRRV